MMRISYKIGGGGGSGLDYVILLSEGGGGGWVLITVDYGGGGGGKKCQKFDYVICERPPSYSMVKFFWIISYMIQKKFGF